MSDKAPDKTASSKPNANRSKTETDRVRAKPAMPQSIAHSNLADAERDIVVELETALSEHISLLLRWNRQLVLPAGTANDEDMPLPRDHGPSSHSKYGTGPHDHDCNFSAWYALNRNNRLVDQPAMQTLAATHEQLHATAQLLLDRHEADGTVDPTEYDLMTLRAESFFAQIRRLERAFRTARSDVDPLTGAYNRQTMMTDLEAERERTLRSDGDAAVALIDLDHFKAINDTYGHRNGDIVLQTISSLLQSHMRPFDKVYRYGGEEFLICLPNADMRQTARILERLRRIIEDSKVTLSNDKTLTVTTSIGAAPMTEKLTIAEIIEKADRALYAAKKGGRNRVRVWRNPSAKDIPSQKP
jgi:diguanylate cyclase (GGDEF)-like protein